MAAAALALFAWHGCADEPAAAGKTAKDSASDGSQEVAATADAAADATQTDDVAAAVDSTPTDARDENGCPGAAGCACQADEECDDGDPCTYGAACDNGTCTAGLPENCDDANVCTQDACVLPGVCTHTAVDHWCEDGDPCSLGDDCTASKCVAGKAAKCDDGNGCTADSCVPGQGCQFAATTAVCADANDCVEASYCQLGQCVQGKAKPCDDQKPCTYDGCDPKTGCEFLPIPAPATVCDGQLESGWCFKAFKADKTWAESRKACQSWGGELATVRSGDDNAVARKQADAACGKISAWIGLSDRAQEGNFVWASGYGGHYSNWNGGEPNNSGNEDVVELVPEGGWNDLSEAAKHGCWVCSRPMQSACDDGNPCTVPGVCGGGTCALPAASTETCDDANPCTLDGCAVALGCGHTPVDDGTVCGSGGACQKGVCAFGKPADLPEIATSCAALPAGGPNGVYWLDADGAGKSPPFQAYCDRGNGGWTLVLKADGSKAENGYDAKLWTEVTQTTAASVWPDAQTAQLPGYALLPVTAVRMVMVVGGKARSLELPAKAANLRELLTGKAVATKAAVVAWEAVLPKGSLQPHCLLQGFNVAAPNGVKARIGIFGNNENDCGTVDSWLGVGATANICGAQGAPTSGNIACWYPDWGDTSTAAMAWIFVK